MNLMENKSGSMKNPKHKRSSSASYYQDNLAKSSEGSQIVENDNPMLRQLLQEVDTAKLYAYCEEVWTGISGSNLWLVCVF